MFIEMDFTRAPIVAPACVPVCKEIGAVVEFLGLVRELENGSALQGLQYEAYEPMALRQLERIFKEIGRRQPVEAVRFIHRLGWVPVGEASLFIRVQSAHRGQALAFCGEAIDWMKRDVPIWKQG